MVSFLRCLNGCLLAAALAVFITGCGAGKEVFELAGTVERQTLELAAPVSEVIVELPVRRGSRVEAGDVVVRLDATVAEAEFKAHEAALAASSAAVAETEREFQRRSGLRRAGVGSQADVDRARRQRDEAVAGVAEREARVAQARKQLENLTIRSYGSGIVDQLPFELGERVPAGGVVAVVQSEERPWVRVWLPARAVARVTSEAQVEVIVEGLEAKIRGRIEDVAREPEYTPHFALTEKESAHLVFQTRVLLLDAPPELRPGLPAQVRLQLSKPAESPS